MKNAMLLAIVTGFLFAGFNALAEEAIDVGSRKQLFIDERFIAENDGITLTVNPPRKEEVVLRPERPWGNKRVGVYSSVVEYEGKYMMWYDASSFESRNIRYAESDDGVHWRRPVTNVVEFEGSTENNIVLKNAVGAVFLDAHGKPKSGSVDRHGESNYSLCESVAGTPTREMQLANEMTLGGSPLAEDLRGKSGKVIIEGK